MGIVVFLSQLNLLWRTPNTQKSSGDPFGHYRIRLYVRCQKRDAARRDLIQTTANLIALTLHFFDSFAVSTNK